MLDPIFVRRKIKLIQEDLGRLETLGDRPLDELARDSIEFSALERLLEKIITRAIDINQHFVAELGRGDERIRGYEDTFHAMAALGVYDKDFGDQIAPSAGLRNRLVHEYNDTKPEIIYQSVGDALAQYARYCDFVLKFIEKQDGKN